MTYFLLKKETDVCNFLDFTFLYECWRDSDIVSKNLEMDGNGYEILVRNKSFEKEMSFVRKSNKIFQHSWVTRLYIRQKFKF